MPGQDISEFPAIAEMDGVAKEGKEPMEYSEEDAREMWVDPLTTEEKIILTHGATQVLPVSLSPEEITEIVQDALTTAQSEDPSLDFLFDIIYDVVEETLVRVNARI